MSMVTRSDFIIPEKPLTSTSAASPSMDTTLPSHLSNDLSMSWIFTLVPGRTATHSPGTGALLNTFCVGLIQLSGLTNV